MNRKRVKLASSLREREKWDNMAELYSIILTVDYLEKAFAKDSIKPDPYVLFFFFHINFSKDTLKHVGN